MHMPRVHQLQLKYQQFDPLEHPHLVQGRCECPLKHCLRCEDYLVYHSSQVFMEVYSLLPIQLLQCYKVIYCVTQMAWSSKNDSYYKYCACSIKIFQPWFVLITTLDYPLDSLRGLIGHVMGKCLILKQFSRTMTILHNQVCSALDPTGTAQW